MNNVLILRDIYALPDLQKRINSLKTIEVIENYKAGLGLSIMSWAVRCLLAFELHNRGYSFEDLAKELNCSRQSLWRESQIWERIISKEPSLLSEPYLSKTWFKRIIEKKVDDPIAELWRIAKEREEISLGNIERRQKGLPTVKQLSTRAYANKGRFYICDVCNNDVTKFFKICEGCLKKIKNEVK